MTPDRTTGARWHALVAVKELSRAKSRLGPAFSVEQKAELVLAMVRDTVTAALATPAVATVTVTSPDPVVRAAVRALGARALTEPASRQDLNRALTDAARAVRARHGKVDLVALQADLPALTAVELGAALARATEAPRSVIVDHRGTGTAALAVRDRDLLPAFGADSAWRHVRSGAVALVGDWPGLRLDVDTRADLESALALGVGAETSAALARIGWPHMCAR